MRIRAESIVIRTTFTYFINYNYSVDVTCEWSSKVADIVAFFRFSSEMRFASLIAIRLVLSIIVQLYNWWWCLWQWLSSPHFVWTMCAGAMSDRYRPFDVVFCVVCLVDATIDSLFAFSEDNWGDLLEFELELAHWRFAENLWRWSVTWVEWGV